MESQSYHLLPSGTPQVPLLSSPSVSILAFTALLHSPGALCHCRDSILYRLVLAYFTAHDNWASQHNVTIVCRVIPHIMRSFPAITHQTQDTFLHLCNAFPCSRLACILMHHHILLRIFAFIVHLCVSRASSHFIAHLCILLHIFTFHHASSHSIVHLHIPSWFSAHHCRSIHPLSSQFLGASHSIYYYIWLHLVSYDYYFIMDPYITSLTYLERSWFTSEPWEGAYVQLRVAISVFTTELLVVTIYHQLVPCSACIHRCSP